MKPISLILIIILLLSPFALNAKINTSALWRSAILAGWGQHYSGAKTKGYIFMGSEVLLLGGSIASYLVQDKAYDDYKDATSDFDNKWDTYKNRVTLCQIAIGVTSAFYLYNLIDAAFITKNVNISSKESPVRLNVCYKEGLLYDASYSKRF